MLMEQGAISEEIEPLPSSRDFYIKTGAANSEGWTGGPGRNHLSLTTFRTHPRGAGPSSASFNASVTTL